MVQSHETAPHAKNPPPMTLAALGWTAARQLEFAPFAAQGLVPGRVVVEHRTHFGVATGSSEVTAELTGRLRKSAGQRSDLPGAGDFVALRLAPGDGNATIEAVLERSTALIRKAAGESRPQLLASNVDVVLIVMALDGDFNLPRLERYLALVRGSGALPVIVANKTDLSSDAAARTGEIRALAPDVALHAISARASGAIGALQQYFEGNKTVVLVGSSGVGKSTLTNLLLGEDVQATQDVRKHDNRGRHTTTHRQLFVRPQGGAILDTPGIRGLELWEENENTAPDFADLDELALLCKFRNCQHTQEPACALRAAVQAGELEPQRLAQFVAHLSKTRA
ncbi:MAG: ribosome small subunit-dependent GTPase A [Hyphomicrobium sp.]